MKSVQAPALRYSRKGAEWEMPILFLVVATWIILNPMARSAQAQANVDTLEPGTRSIHYTPSGIQFWDIEVGHGPQPHHNGVVKLHFTAWLLDGTRLYTTRDDNKPVVVALDGAQHAWAEALGSMKVGGRRRIQLAARMGPTLPEIVAPAPDTPLVFELLLLDVRGRAITGFQAIALIVLSILFAGSVGSALKGWIRRRAGLAWSMVWVAAAVAIVRPDFTAVIARKLGIGRGADLVLYSAVVVMLVGFLMVYSRLTNLRREMTVLVRHLAIRDAHVGSEHKAMDDQLES